MRNNQWRQKTHDFVQIVVRLPFLIEQSFFWRGNERGRNSDSNREYVRAAVAVCTNISYVLTDVEYKRKEPLLLNGVDGVFELMRSLVMQWDLVGSELQISL